MDFVLQYHDGTDWKDVPGTDTAGNAKFSPVTTARHRLLVTAARGDLIRIWEFEVYRVPEPQ
jgi:hypothetical protein